MQCSVLWTGLCIKHSFHFFVHTNTHMNLTHEQLLLPGAELAECRRSYLLSQLATTLRQWVYNKGRRKMRTTWWPTNTLGVLCQAGQRTWNADAHVHLLMAQIQYLASYVYHLVGSPLEKWPLCSWRTEEQEGDKTAVYRTRQQWTELPCLLFLQIVVSTVRSDLKADLFWHQK